MAIKIDPEVIDALKESYSEWRWCYLRREERKLLTDPNQIRGKAKSMLFPVLSGAAHIIHMHRFGVIAVGIHRDKDGKAEPGVRVAAAIVGTGDMFSRAKGINLALRRLVLADGHSMPLDLSKNDIGLGRIIKDLGFRLPQTCRQAYAMSVYAFRAMIKDITGEDLKGLRPEIAGAAGMIEVDTKRMAEKFNRLATMEATVQEFNPAKMAAFTQVLGGLAKAIKCAVDEHEKEASKAKTGANPN